MNVVAGVSEGTSKRTSHGGSSLDATEFGAKSPPSLEMFDRIRTQILFEAIDLLEAL
jgi:hypothetical protein